MAFPPKDDGGDEPKGKSGNPGNLKAMLKGARKKNRKKGRGK